MFTENDKEQMTKFISMLYHDDKNSNYFICQYIGGTMFSERITYNTFSTDKVADTDCYISLNGFTGYHRRIKECRQINGIVYDLDCHDNTTPAYLDWIKKRSLILIMEAVADKQLYEPNIITDTARGLQLIYLFDQSVPYRLKGGKKNEKAIYAYNKIRDNIEEKLENILLSEENTLIMDKRVFDLSRIIRIPGTVNNMTGTKAYIVHTNEDYYSFSDFYTPKETSASKIEPPENKSYGKKFKNNEALNEARVAEMEKLQFLRKNKCEGYRNYMTFIYYNSAVQIYNRKEAAEKTYSFCKNFGESNTAFTETQIRTIIRGIDNNSGKDFNGYYIISKEWIIDKLDITDEEAELIGMDKTINSRELKKRKNAQIKQERNALILKMADKNIRHSDIAKEVGVSLRTVQNILKNQGKTRDYTTKVNVQKYAS